MVIKGFWAREEFCVELFDRGNFIRLCTPDKPRKELYQVMSDFVIAATGYFGMPSACWFYGIELEPDKARLEMEISTAVKNEYARIVFPWVSRAVLYDSSKEVDREHPRNIFNYRLDVFVNAIADYAAGKRGDPTLFEGKEQGERVITFPGRDPA